MRLPFDVHLPDRRRAASFALALVIEALLILVLLLFGPHFTPPSKSKRLPTSFSLSPDKADRAATAPEQHKARAAAKPAAGNPPPITPPPSPIPPPPKALTNQTKLNGVLPIQLGDISKIKSSAPADSGDTGDSNADSKLAYGPSEGPGGMALYPAEWYRRPSDAELNGFLTKPPPSGSWALIACRTIANYHVDNCRQLGESPLGSGLARSMRLAAWQFLVRPPRKGGKPMVGAWVSIRIDFHTIYVRGKSPAGDESDDDDKSSADK